MTSLLERRYRRVLRLLPVGYRRAWEEDMVSTFLARASEQSGRGPSLAERLSVVALAARLWLGGDRTVTDVRPRRRFLYCLMLMVLLLLALSGITALVSSVRWTVAHAAGDVRTVGSAVDFFTGQAVTAVAGLLLVVAFWCFASGRIIVPRLITMAALVVVVTVAMMSTVEAVVAVIATNVSALRLLDPIAAIPLVAVTGLFTWAVWAASAAGPAPRRRLWLAGFAAAALVETVTLVARYVRPGLSLPSYVSAGGLAMLALAAGMVYALSTRAGRHRVDWLFALAALAGGLVVARLMLTSGRVAVDAIWWTALDVVLVVLALACAGRGWVVTRAARIAGG